MDDAEQRQEPEGLDMLATAAAKVAHAMGHPSSDDWTEEDNRIARVLADLMAAGDNHTFTLSADTILGFLTAAYGCHEAADKLRKSGNLAQADDRASLGQLFLKFSADYVVLAQTAFIEEQKPKAHDTRH